ncbi:hypothetical protein [Cytobacillus horneckiae]|uniref:hypothetical protein n=1 Tax=Cytobacillus horneckiae TaxID=549687 RepID=UPI003D21FC67
MMEIKKRQRVTLDLRKNLAVPTPTFVQNDTNILEFIIKDNGADADLSNVDNITVTFKRPDGTITTTKLNQVGNVITYHFGFEEMAIPGHGELSIQFFQGSNRLSSNNLKVYFAKSLSTEFEKSAGMPILQELFIEVATVTENAIDAGNYALEQAAEADQKAKYAKTQGDRAKAEADRLQGTDVSKLDQQVRTINEQLSASNRHHQILSQDQHILNGSQNAPLDIHIEGRTLIPMQNTVLDAAKYYVLADKKTSLKWADNTVTQGIAKFTGKAEKPRVIKITNFEGKVFGSTMENPHVMKRAGNQSNFVPPTGTWQELSTPENVQVSKLDSNVLRQTSINANAIPQKLMSFNLIEEVERTIGRIPRSTVAEKIQWLKENITRITCNWHGFGSGVAGNKASLTVWAYGDWQDSNSNTSSNVTRISRSLTTSNDMVNSIDSNGFTHFLVYGEPSDGNATSYLNTDYVDFEIEFKTTATLHDPCIPLYEVGRTEYDKILANYDENTVIARYPRLQGMQHLQNPYVIAEGGNLLDPYSVKNANILNLFEQPYSAEFEWSNGFSLYLAEKLPVNKNQTYTFKYEKELFSNDVSIYISDETDTVNLIAGTTNKTLTFNTGNYSRINIRAIRTNALPGKVKLFNWILTLGSSGKPFVARNPSHLFANVILSQIGDRKDTLFRDNGEWKLRREIVRDVVLDGSLPWKLANDLLGIKRISVEVPNASSLIPATPSMININQIATKHDGTALKLFLSVPTERDQFALFGVTGQAHDKQIFLSVSDTDSGFAESYVPIQNEIKAYFNGWKVKLIDLNGKPTAWQSVVDGKDAPTQTLTYVSANRAPNYTPYKLSYALATPVTEVVTEKVEGDIAINGLTQVEVGSGVIIREKAKTEASSTVVHINDVERPNTYLEYKADKIINIYKNGVIDNGWAIASGRSFGISRASLPISDFDATAEYTVTYLALDRQLFTTNPVSIPVSWAGSLKGTVTDVVNKQADDRAQISVNTRLIYDVLLRLKAGGL